MHPGCLRRRPARPGGWGCRATDALLPAGTPMADTRHNPQPGRADIAPPALRSAARSRRATHAFSSFRRRWGGALSDLQISRARDDSGGPIVVQIVYGQKSPTAISAEVSEALDLAAGKKRGFCQRGRVGPFWAAYASVV